MATVRIVPPKPDESGVTKTQGTMVYVGDTPIDRVFKIVLTADVSDVWRAEIHVHGVPPSIEAEASLILHSQSLWSKLKAKFKRKPYDVTAMEGEVREYR